MSGYIQKDDAYSQFCGFSLSPRVKKFISGLDNGTAGINWALLDSLGFKQKDGSYFRILESWRSYDRQCEIYKSGRLVTFEKVTDSKGYKYTKLTDKIVLSSAVSTYAWGGQSYHNFGLAVDLVIRSFGEVAKGQTVSHGGRSWESLEAFYSDIGLLNWAKTCGLEWGGYWTRPYDCVHWQDSNYVLPNDVYNYMCSYDYISNNSSSVDTDNTTNKKSKNTGLLLLLGVVVLFFVFFSKSKK